LRRYIRESPVDEDTALMDDIVEVGIGGHYLARKSTRAHARSEVWRPEVFQRGTFEEHRAPGRSLLEEAVARARHLLATHEVAPLSDDAEREIEAVIANRKAARP
jgi:trimethylamine--corrinoid protein Co-methyltransferase